MTPRVAGAVLWVVAAAFMLASAVYQRLTGPTRPVRGEVVVDGQPRRYRLLRSEETVRAARIAVPSPASDATGIVYFRRHPSEDPFTPLAMRAEGDPAGQLELAAYLPAQPPAGKLEYRVEVRSAGESLRIPSAPAGGSDDTIVLRYKDPVPRALLLSHVALMFFAVLVGLRAGLGALVAPQTLRRDAWLALGLMTVGGMILGPIVQEFAFGAYWTGFPWGYDLTDNKTLLMWLAWIVACAALGRGGAAAPPGRGRRATVFAAAVVMTVVYLIPHSLRGSELDYAQADAGTPAEEAVESGR